MTDVLGFWETRARQYAGEGRGLRAVCSYAMPGFYNWCIDLTQRRALRGFIDSVRPGVRVLDYGCGVGRWSRELAQRGAQVTGIDLSEAMLAEARRRTAQAGLTDRCTFVQADVADLNLQGEFDLVLGVTVLQHVLDDARLFKAIARFAERLRPGGRLVMLEAAPMRVDGRADTATFHARPLSAYLAAIHAAGFQVEDITGVDPMPFKLAVVPRFRRWPRSVAVAALTLASACALPLDLLLASRLISRSWHKIIVARAPGERR